MSSGMQKPTVAPKPKLAQYQRAGPSPPIPKRDGLSQPSPATQRKAKPALAPKPCLAKLTPKSKPLISKSQSQTSALETPTTVGRLNSENGLQQGGKKPDWDYVIPICLCSQENCSCIRNRNLKKTEKDFETPLRDRTVENREAVLTSRETLDHHQGKAGNGNSQVINVSNRKPLHETFIADKDPNTDSDTSSPEVSVKPRLPHTTLYDEERANAIFQSVPGQGPEDVASEETRLSPPKSTSRKPLHVPVPRKDRTAVQVHQEKVEGQREETAIEEGREEDVKECKMSLDGMGSSFSSVSGPESENKLPVFLSARRACGPPVPPPRKKPFLCNPKKTPTSAPQTPPKDGQEDDLAWESSIYEREISVDGDDEEIQREREAECGSTDSHLLSPPEINQCRSVATAAEENAMANVTPKKPQRHKSPVLMKKREFLEEDEAEKLEDYEAIQVCPLRHGAPEEQMTRELSLPPNENSSNSLSTAVYAKSSRSSLNKQKAKSFSTADVARSDVQKRNTFRKLLDSKLKMFPKMIAKGGQSPVTGSEQDLLRDQSTFEDPSAERKLSCPLIGVEQSVDGDEFEEVLPRKSHVYEDILDYTNVDVGKAESSPPGSLSQPWHNSLYDDEGIYEEQLPYMSLVKTQCQTPKECDSSVDEEMAFQNEAPSDDDIEANTSDDDEEDEDDSSSASSKGDPDQPDQTTTPTGQKKSKIHHIATEIMSSESVFVDVLKLLHVDFRDAVTAAPRQSGKPVIEERLLNQILYYLPQLYELNQDLLREFTQRVAKWDGNSQLADIFLKKGPYLKMYSTYIREFDKNVALLVEQTKKNAAFGAVVKEFEASPRCANLALKHYLLKPVQRIPQYQLLLTDYLKNLSEDSNDYKDTQAALAIVKEVANHANDIMKQGDNFQKLIQVQCRLNGHHEVVQPGRIFLKEGVLMKLSRKVMQPRMFFLFNDTLLYTTPVQSGQYKLKNILSLAGMKVSKPSQEAYQNELNIESVERSFILSASSATERDEWLDAISTAISDFTKKKISFISGKPLDEVEISDGSPLGSKAPIWIPDPRTTMCMICTCEFTLTWRRHHCRACGKVVCQSCSSNKYCLEYLKNQLARVCDHCFVILQEQKSEMASSAAISPGNKATFAFSRRTKKIPAALKEVTANTDNSSMSGYLQRSKHSKKQGKRLWFVIKDKVLYTYAASEDVAALESQPLLGFLLKVDSSKKTQFTLYHKNILYYIFRADDVQTAQRWIDSFKDAAVL
ncbi:FYVE, RhoGEF and PH domain-containing protein 6-like [Cololabis saira]|uniref:FYVE, RhoGEF and PH domain-containing protein 6-like n=1 Tax=Cololabis saira TaxID=129043 RepID=UPI002AD3C4D6|nr:FYVE, RhoGEF and PH domain-containing protein 6-like [Cololabis saira]